MRRVRSGLALGGLMALGCGGTTTEPERLQALDVFGRVYDVEVGVGMAGVGLIVHMPGGPVGRSTLVTGETDAEGGYHMRVTFDGEGLPCEPGWLDLGVALPEGYGPPAEGPDMEPLECTALPQRRDIALHLGIVVGLR
jgi:hypothetical protein